MKAATNAMYDAQNALNTAAEEFAQTDEFCAM
jgi:hypothetical protein